MKIVEDDLEGEAIAALLRHHVQGTFDTSPEDGAFALSIDALRLPGVTVWSAWEDAEILGCGALRELDAESGEIKSMRTADAHLGKGVAMSVLGHVIGVARDRGYRALYLETGSSPAFEPARRLYQKAGFTDCGPFADYRENPVSRFMVLTL